MANIKSAKKRILVNQTKADRNKAIRSAVKTSMKKVDAAVAANDKEAAAAALVNAISTIDKAASKGVYHKNNAARNKDINQRELSHTVMWLGSFFMLTKRVRRDRSFDKHRTRRIGQFSCTGTPCSFYSNPRK